jgi:N utilization substance protein A
VQAIVDELRGEKIDIIPWNADTSLFVASALSPAKVMRVDIHEETKTALVIVPDHQLSLAIGREGQNARLAAKLTGWRIDIKSETQLKEIEAQKIFIDLPPEETAAAPAAEPAAAEQPAAEAAAVPGEAGEGVAPLAAASGAADEPAPAGAAVAHEAGEPAPEAREEAAG